MRRYLLIAGIALAVILVGVGAYFLFFHKSSGVVVSSSSGANLPVAGNTPTSSSGAGGAGQLTGAPPVATSTAVSVSNRLVEISAQPVVPGEAVLDTGSSTAPTTLVRYIDQQSGNVYQYDSTSHTVTRINDKTLPGIASAQWFPDGSAALVRFLSGTDLSTINTYVLAASSTEGFFLPQGLSGAAVSATALLTTASGVNGSVISTSQLDGSRTTTLFSTPLTAVKSFFAGNRYLVVSKPSGTLPGYAFLVSRSGHFSRLIGPEDGLMTLPSPDGAEVLTSYVQAGSIHMSLIDTATDAATPLPLATLVDTCVWAPDGSAVFCGVPQTVPDGTYPDDWYQGAVHFSDRLWKINVSGRYAQLLLDFSQTTNGPSAVDAEALAVDKDNSLLVFVNKNDGSLWGYRL